MSAAIHTDVNVIYFYFFSAKFSKNGDMSKNFRGENNFNPFWNKAGMKENVEKVDGCESSGGWAEVVFIKPSGGR